MRRETGLVAFDTETTSLDPMQAELVGFSLAIADNARTRPARRSAPPMCRWSTRPASAICSAAGCSKTRSRCARRSARLKPLLEDPSVLKVAQNLKYDYLLMKRHGITVAGLRRHDADVLRARRRQRHAWHGSRSPSAGSNHKPIAYKDVAGTGKARVTFDHGRHRPRHGLCRRGCRRHAAPLAWC